ncbi:Ribose ABC transport system, permease protein RbsC [Caenispirillum salinarum AK4]|uniref:Ribose ABC transport system, permease protein RbsC n=1 Tax=Caenispirillum salinarum AK4 TaxID=1238182 RepID=K9GSP8_9PROT|nr:ribose ABC transporter permease [Caenispirillum salinarum]EKV28157.1 Ribose ABC transport system, permease protein RbsC [Caenispirillum salinarum AK4]
MPSNATSRTAETAANGGAGKAVLRFLAANKSLVGLILLMAVVSLFSPNFLTVDNLLNILRQTSINAIIAMGMTFVILTAGIDLSVGSVLAFTGAVCASLVAADASLWVALPATLALGAALGAANGVVIAIGGVQPFIATLVGMTVLRGATLVYTDGRPITTMSDPFWAIGGEYVFGIPVPVLIAAFAFIVCWFVLSQMRFGRYVYAVGGNEQVTRLAGISVTRVKIAVYAVSGLMAALAGIILTARLESAQPTAGTAYELDAIAAVVLGGTSLMGGRGYIFGTLIGALIIGVLNNALNLMDVSSYYQMIAKGAVILLAVLVDSRGKTNR